MITERHRIALELHDGIVQDLVGIGYALDLLLAEENQRAETRVSIRTLRFTVTEMIEKVRRDIYLLRKTTPLYLTDRLRALAEDICRAQLLHFSLDHFPTAENYDRAEQIERIATEILRNIATHARAKNVWIILICSDSFADLYIRDDGIGGLKESENHYGFSGIRERARIVDGKIDFESNSNGTQIHLRVPYHSPSAIKPYG